MVTTDLLLKALKENTDHTVQSFTTNLGALSHKVEDNSVSIRDNEATIRKHTTDIDGHSVEIDRLSSRIQALERSGTSHGLVQVRRAKLSDEYVTARRSVRLWPICGGNLRGEVGDFLHCTMKIPGHELCQEDIGWNAELLII